MTVKIKETTVDSELELEDLLFHEPEAVEEGFRLLTRQPRTSPKSNRLDLLGVDSEGTLAVIELKIREDDEQLIQALEYFDLLLERGIHFFRDHFSFKDIELTTPRIILIARTSRSAPKRHVSICPMISTLASEDTSVTRSIATRKLSL